jgi:hypothetical protein
VTPPRLFYKTVSRDGCNLKPNAPRLNYEDAFMTGRAVRHPTSTRIDVDDHATFLSIASTPGDSLGNYRYFPGRLFVVEPLGELRCMDEAHPKVGPPTWYAALALRVVQEKPSWMAFGDNGLLVFDVFREMLELDHATLLRLAEQRLSRTTDLDKANAITWDSGRNTAGNAALLIASNLIARILIIEGEPLEVARAAAAAVGEAAAASAWRDLLPRGLWEQLTASWRAVLGDELLTAYVRPPELAERMAEAQRDYDAAQARIARFNAGIVHFITGVSKIT